MTFSRRMVLLLPMLAWVACARPADQAPAGTALPSPAAGWPAPAVTPRPYAVTATRFILLAAAGVSLDQAVALAEHHYHARVVRTDVRQEGTHKVYVLRLLNDSGRVWTVRIDAATGATI